MNQGARIKHARESRGYSQTELARLMGMPQAALSRTENQEQVDYQLLMKFSTVLGYPVSYFDKEPFRIRDNGTMHYRKRASVKVKDLMKYDSHNDDLLIAIDALMDSIDIPELDIPSIIPTPELTPAAIAYNLRQALGLGIQPVDRIVHLLEKHGIIVYFLNPEGEAADKIDGFTAFTPKGYAVILADGTRSNDRIRFTLAHELGHLVMHLRRGEKPAESEDEQEDQANQFAAEFLMPRDVCGRDFYGLKFRELAFWKRKWLVSKAAIIHRAAELGCITASTAQYYYITMGRIGEKKQESVWVDCDRPVMVQKMVTLHRNALGYSDEELTQIMGLYPNQVVESTPDSPKLKLSL